MNSSVFEKSFLDSDALVALQNAVDLYPKSVAHRDVVEPISACAMWNCEGSCFGTCEGSCKDDCPGSCQGDATGW